MAVGDCRVRGAGLRAEPGGGRRGAGGLLPDRRTRTSRGSSAGCGAVGRREIPPGTCRLEPYMRRAPRAPRRPAQPQHSVRLVSGPPPSLRPAPPQLPLEPGLSVLGPDCSDPPPAPSRPHPIRPRSSPRPPTTASQAGGARASRAPEVASAQLPARGAGGRCQLRIRGPVRMQHEGFPRRRRGSAPRLGTPPHCHVRRRIARGARISWPIRSCRARASEGGSHSRPAEGGGGSHQSQVEGEKVLRREPMRGWGRVRARAPRPIPGEGEGGPRGDSESGAGANGGTQSEREGGGPRRPRANPGGRARAAAGFKGAGRAARALEASLSGGAN